MKTRFMLPGIVAGLAVFAVASTPAYAEMTVSVGGRIQVDGTAFDEDEVDLNSGTEFRRARLFASGNIADDWKYKAQYDFAGNGTTLKDLYIQYTGFDFGKFTVGQFKQEMGLEELTSSKYITFMERAMLNAFVPSRRIGIGFSGDNDAWHYAASVFGQEEDDSEGADEGMGVAGRLTWGPKWGDNQLHFGASANWQEPPSTDDEEYRVRARPEAHQSNVRFVDSGTLTDVDNIVTYGLEGAGVFGPFSVQGEWMQQTVNRDQGDEPDFSGYYVYGSWFITGESRSYKGGKFGRTKATNAWEVAVRYSSLDLEDGSINGGEEDNITLAVNYYVNPYLRFMANYIAVDADPTAASVGIGGDQDEPNIFMVRAAMDFK